MVVVGQFEPQINSRLPLFLFIPLRIIINMSQDKQKMGHNQVYTKVNVPVYEGIRSIIEAFSAFPCKPGEPHYAHSHSKILSLHIAGGYRYMGRIWIALYSELLDSSVNAGI